MKNLKAEKLTTIDYMFEGKYYTQPNNETNQQKEERLSYTRNRLKTVNLSGWKCPSLQYMDNMFRECRALQSVDLSGFDTINVISMKDMFSNCKNIETINFNALNTTNISMNNLRGMFAGCSDEFTIMLNREENDLDSTTRAKIRKAYEIGDPQNYMRTYQETNRYKVFGHVPIREWIPIIVDEVDVGHYIYYWSGTVNFITVR